MDLRRFALPSPADTVFILFLLSVTLVRGHQAINTDGDLGRHIRVGETILAEGGLFYTDRFSHTMAGQPFVPYEWLSEVLFAAAHRLGGLAGALVLTGIVVAAAYALVVLFLQRSGVDPLLAFATAIAAGVLGAVHWLARPHVFTLLGAVATLWLLERGGRRAPVVAVGIFALWANLHGGFLYGLVLIGLYLAGDALEIRWGHGRAHWVGRLRQHGLLLAGALAGTLINPSGPVLLAHVVGYLGKGYLVDGTAEYQSPDFHALYGRIFMVVVLGVIAALALGGRRPAFPRLVAVLVSLAFALMSIRNIPLFGLVALPLVVLHLSAGPVAWRSRSHGPRSRGVRRGRAFGGVRRVERGRRSSAPRGSGRSVGSGGPSASGGRFRSGGVSCGGRCACPGRRPFRAGLQRVRVGRVSALRLAGAEGIHRRTDRLLRRGSHQELRRDPRPPTRVARGARAPPYITSASSARYSPVASPGVGGMGTVVRRLDGGGSPAA